MNARIEKIKKHFQDNKGTYIACGVTAVVAVAGTLFFVKNKTMPPQIISTIAPVFNNEVNPVIINLVERSTPSKPVHLVGTNLYFSSLGEAARETGHSLQKLSKHINGHLPDLDGDVFELLQPAA